MEPFETLALVACTSATSSGSRRGLGRVCDYPGRSGGEDVAAMLLRVHVFLRAFVHAVALGLPPRVPLELTSMGETDETSVSRSQPGMQ